MTGVLSFSTGAEFIYRVYKHHADDPSKTWVNTYEVAASAGGTFSTLQDLGDKLALYEEALHLDNTVFDRWTVGTYEPDSHPYDPAAFFVQDLGGALGERDHETDAASLGLRVALSVRREVQTGRSGKLFYRNVLTENDVQGPAGEETLTSVATWEGYLAAAIAAGSLGGYLGGYGDLHLALIGVNKAHTKFTRYVSALHAHGTAFVSTNHRWFNRYSAPNGPAPVEQSIVYAIDPPTP